MIVKVDIEGEVLELNIPFSEKEITFDQFCEYLNYYIEMVENDDLAQVQSMLNIFDFDLNKLPFGDDSFYNLFLSDYTLDFGDDITCIKVISHIDTIIRNSYSIYVHSLLSKIDHSDPDMQELLGMLKSKNTFVQYRALLRLSSEINLLDYDESSLSINLDNEIYSLYQSDIAKFYSEGITGGEYVEVMEYRRKISSILEEKNKYFDGLLELKNTLHLTAVLFRKQGESLPIDRTHLKKFKDQRMTLFSKISLDKVLEICFFLTSSLQELGLTKILEHTGILQTTKQKAKMLKRV